MFKAQTVDSILSVFKDTITKLEKLEQDEGKAVANNSEVVAKLLADSSNREAEIRRAQAAREKLNAIFN